MLNKAGAKVNEEELEKIEEENALLEGLVSRSNNVGGKIYVDNNTDRFGKPILPRKPMELKPGPGQYQQSI